MTLHDKMLAVYRGDIPDAVPVAIYSRYLPRGSAERELRELGCGIIEYHPLTSLLSPPWHFLGGYVSEVKGCESSEHFFWENGKPCFRRVFKTPVGEVFQEMQPDDAGAGSEHIRRHYIESADDYRVIQYIVENTVIRSNESAVKRKKTELGGDGVLFGRLDRCAYQKLLIELCGPETFFIDLAVDPERVLELMETMEKKLDEAFYLALDSEAEIFWQADNITSDMTPPNYFERFCLPVYKKRAKALGALGKPYLIHMDGKLKALSGLIRDAAFPVIESLTLPRMGGDMTYTEARDALNKIVVPNFPSNLCVEDDAAVERFVRELKEEAAGTPFLLQVSEDIPPGEWRRVLPVILRAVR